MGSKLLALLVMLFLGAHVVPTASAQSALQELVKQIEKKGTGASAAQFKKLTAFKNETSFKAMQRVCKSLQNAGNLRAAYAAFDAYRDVPGLSRRAISYLAGEADSGLERARRAAAAGLIRHGARAEPELRELLGAKDEVVRGYAIKPLIPILGQEGTPKALELILDSLRLGTSGNRTQLLQALQPFTAEECNRTFASRLVDSKVDSLLKVLIIETIAARRQPGVSEALVRALRDKSTDVQFAALEALGARGETSHVKALKKLVRSEDDAVRRLAVISLARWLGTDPRWFRELQSMAGDKNPATRQGAAVALAELRTPEALEVLHKMLADTDLAVRRQTLQLVGNLRRKESLPFLMGRLNGERGRLKMDLLTTLRLITGLDNGTSYERWKRWWDHEGATFTVPAYEVALEAEKSRQKRANEGRTVSSFYGLEVVSDRVCFVLDTSSSMRSKSGKKTKIEAAKEELANALRKYPGADLFNIVFFSSDVHAWQDELVEMNDERRSKALSYVSRQKASGTTALYDALKLAFQDKRVDTLFLLTDGSPQGGAIDDPVAIREEVQHWNSARHIRIHCVSVGRGSRLLKWLAKDTGGKYREVK